MTKIKKAFERLEDLLSKKESEIAELQEKIDAGESFNDWRWRDIRKLSKKENRNLPIPRLEIRYERMADGESLALYGIVYRHFLKDILLIPFSATKVGSHRPLEVQDLPFRDGAHIRNEMEQLKLPGYLIHGEKTTKL